jgi:hypothetical protein
MAAGSADPRYRYRWPEAEPYIIDPANKRIAVFVLCNPATEDEANDDSGSHRTRQWCINRAKKWGCGRVITVNLFARRGRVPNRLKGLRLDELVGPANDGKILAAAQEAAASDGLLICAWGNDGCRFDRDRAVMALLKRSAPNIQPMALKLTDKRAPHHPRGLRRDLQPQLYLGRPDQS